MTLLARRRLEQALHLLGADPATADALTRADALWLARVLPREEEDSADAEAPPDAPVAPAELPPTPDVAPLPRDAEAMHPADEPALAGPADAPAAPVVEEAQDVSLFVHQPGDGSEPQLHARRVPVPAADALPGRAAFERALRPFLRRRPSRTRRMVDAEATAEASAQASADALLSHGPDSPGRRAMALVPVLRPVPERWFDLLLLAEHDDTMRVFDDTLKELRQLLARHGAFHRVGLWRWRVRDGAMHVQTASGMACAPRAMLQGQHPQLVWVLTHGASTQWARPELRDFVRSLADRAVVAIVQMLPETAWGATALGESQERVRSRERGATNRQLLTQDAWTATWARHPAHGVLPMLSLRADAVARWAEFVMAPRSLEHAAVLVEATAGDLPHTNAAAGADARAAIRDQVLRFRAVASPPAFALLRLLSGAWITLPVMRLLQQSLPGSRAALAPMAEVLLSGLLQRTSPADARTEELTFDFAPGVRDWLSGSLSSAEQRALDAAMAESKEAIRRFVEEKTGRRLASFSALLLDDEGTELLPQSARSFVEVSRQLRLARRTPITPIASGATPPVVSEQEEAEVAAELEAQNSSPQPLTDEAFQRAWESWRADSATDPAWIQAMVALSRAPSADIGMSLATAISGLADEEALARLVAAVEPMGLLRYDAGRRRLHPPSEHAMHGEPRPDAQQVVARMTPWFTARFETPANASASAWTEVQAEADALRSWLKALHMPSDMLHIARVGHDYALTHGPFGAWVDFYNRGLEHVDLADREDLARYLTMVFGQAGALDEAFRAAQRLRYIVNELGDDRGRARAAGLYADVLYAQGRYSEALYMRQTEELPLFEKVGDEPSQAAALAAIASACEVLGRSEEALHTLRNKVRPLCERLGLTSLKAAVAERIVALEKRFQPPIQFHKSPTPPWCEAIFISAVASEFGDCVRGLREVLVPKGIRVISLDDYTTDGISALQQIDEIIRGCDTVIHFVGDACDAIAPTDSVQALLQQYTDLSSHIPRLSTAPDEGPQLLSYQQWEAWLALHHSKRLYVALPTPDTLRGSDAHGDAQVSRQRMHLHALRHEQPAKDPIEFNSVADLCEQVVSSITKIPDDWDPFSESPALAIRSDAPQEINRENPAPQISTRWSALSPGHTLGRYEIIKSIGQDEVGTIYEARDPLANRLVAVKTARIDNLPAALADKYELHFRIEARQSARLRHPNIVEAYEGGRDKGTAYLAVELTPGGSLRGLLRDRATPDFERSMAVMQELLAALSHAHAQGIVHNNVNPVSVMLGATGSVKLGNFDFMHLPDSPDLTWIVALDTAPYRSPEITRGGYTPDPRSDLFSVGAVLYEMLTGVKPFTGSGANAVFEIFRAISEEHPTPASTLNPRLPTGIDEIIAKALAKNPDERFASAEDFSAALQELASQHETGSPDGDGFQGFLDKVLQPVTDVADAEAPPDTPAIGAEEWPSPLPASPLITLGRYEILRPLDTGGMGTVYEARDPSASRHVAIKTVRIDRLSANHAEAYEAHFRAEVEISSRLKHPHIVEVLDAGYDHGLAFLVMELISGGDLKQLLLRGVRPTLDRSMAIMQELLSALAYAHGRGVIHRDITPANVMLDTMGGVKLGDFGAASASKEDADGTQPGLPLAGTPSYMSPEQIQGRPLDARSDLFSAGVVLYEMLTGTKPFAGEQTFAVMQAIVQDDPAPPSSLNPDLPAGIDNVLAKALAKNADQRFTSAADFSDALRDAATRTRKQAISSQHSTDTERAMFEQAIAEGTRQRNVHGVVEDAVGLALSAKTDEFHAEFLRLVLRFREEGRQRNDAFFFEVATSLARRRLDFSLDRQESLDTHLLLGDTLSASAEFEGTAARWEEAVQACREALQVSVNAGLRPGLQAEYQARLGNALRALGEHEGDLARFEEAGGLLREVLAAMPKEQSPHVRMNALNNLGFVISVQAARDGAGTALLEEAAQLFKTAIADMPKPPEPLEWAVLNDNLGCVQRAIGERERNTTWLVEAAQAHDTARDAYTHAQQTRERAAATADVAAITSLIAELQGKA